MDSRQSGPEQFPSPCREVRSCGKRMDQSSQMRPYVLTALGTNRNVSTIYIVKEIRYDFDDCSYFVLMLVTGSLLECGLERRRLVSTQSLRGHFVIVTGFNFS